MPVRLRLLLVAMDKANRKPLATLTPEQIAKARALSPPPVFPATLVTGALRSHVTRSTTSIPMRDGTQIPARTYSPRQRAEGSAVFIYYHGGGWTMGRPMDYDSLLTMIADELGVLVVAPDYRKAPQDKAPQAVLDCIDTFEWVRSEPAELAGVGRIVIGGDSAGGNLSALVALHARDTEAELAGQVLIYPAVDLSIHQQLRDAPMLDGEALDVYKAHYLDGSGIAPEDPQISPLRATSHAGLAPALVQTAERDPLCEEGEVYAETLRAAGVATRHTRYHAMPHGFLNLPGVAPASVQARWEIVDQVRQWLA